MYELATRSAQINENLIFYPKIINVAPNRLDLKAFSLAYLTS